MQYALQVLVHAQSVEISDGLLSDGEEQTVLK
jgi:hypothetical protein